MKKLIQKLHLRKRTRHKDADMTQGVIWKQLLEFSLPLMLGMLFQQFYNTVDTIVVGQFVGKEALAAVGSTAMICPARIFPTVTILSPICAQIAAFSMVCI